MKLLACFALLLTVVSVAESGKRSRRLLNAASPPASPPSCQPPMWGAMRLGENWALAGHPTISTEPYFRLIVRGLDTQGHYKPGKKHTVIVRMNNRRGKKVKLTGFYVTLESVPNSITEDCGGRGVFKATKSKKVKVGSPPSGCTQPLILDTGKRQLKSGSGKWVAPTCGDVILRATVRGADRRQYSDSDDEVDEAYQVLTKRLSPSVH